MNKHYNYNIYCCVYPYIVVKQLDVYVKELEEDTIYEIDSVEDYNNLLLLLILGKY